MDPDDEIHIDPEELARMMRDWGTAWERMERNAFFTGKTLFDLKEELEKFKYNHPMYRPRIPLLHEALLETFTWTELETMQIRYREDHPDVILGWDRKGHLIIPCDFEKAEVLESLRIAVQETIVKARRALMRKWQYTRDPARAILEREDIYRRVANPEKLIHTHFWREFLDSKRKMDQWEEEKTHDDERPF